MTLREFQSNMVINENSTQICKSQLFDLKLKTVILIDFLVKFRVNISITKYNILILLWSLNIILGISFSYNDNNFRIKVSVSTNTFKITFLWIS